MPSDIKYDSSRIGARTRKTDQSNLSYGKIPPQVPELEEAVLGAIMLEGDKLSDVLEVLPKSDCFYSEKHKKIFAAIQNLASEGQVVDLLTVIDELKRKGDLELVGGPYAVTKLTDSVVSSAHVMAHARIVMEKFILRELIKISSEMINNSYEDSAEVFDLLDKAETNLFEISNNYLRKNYSDIKDILVETVRQIEKSKEDKEDITGVPSGFKELDSLTAGWQKTDLIILAARPSVGKTAFSLNLALNAAMHASKPSPVAIFSLEMSNIQLVKRMLSTVTNIPLENINHGRLSNSEFTQLTTQMQPLSKAPIFIDDQAGLSIFELRAKARRLKSKHDIQLIIIDYLQLMHGGGDKKFGNREQEISKISRELKGIAKELEIPVIALSQLSRAVETRSDKNKIPQLSDLRESGAIEQDADMVMFIYRPEYYRTGNDENGQVAEGETHINIAKHRNGRLGMVKLIAHLNIQKFVDFNETTHYSGPFAGMGANNNDDFTGGMSIDKNFKTLPSKANNLSYDDDEDGGFNSGFSKRFKHKPGGDEPNPSDDTSAPFSTSGL